MPHHIQVFHSLKHVTLDGKICRNAFLMKGQQEQHWLQKRNVYVENDKNDVALLLSGLTNH